MNGRFYLQIWHRKRILLLFKVLGSIIQLFDKYGLIRLSCVLLNRFLPRCLCGNSDDALPLKAEAASLASLGVNHI